MQKEIEQHLKDLSEIRSMMEQSSKFLSLSGVSGITVGLVGLAAAGFAHWYAKKHSLPIFEASNNKLDSGVQVILVLNAFAAFVLALGCAVFFSTRMAKKKGLPIWSPSTKYLLVHLFVPLLAGGIFCAALLKYGTLFLIAPAMLIFYGLALLNASKFTLNEVRYLGYAQITVGLLALIWVKYGLLFWALGFGLLHIINGVVMYRKYET